MSAAHVDERAVFNVARQMSDAEARESFLRLACGDDVEALRRVREMLRLHEQKGSFLESPPGGMFAPLFHAPLESAGSMIGSYRLLEQIGEGGFGVVFMAEQTAPVRRKVALKVLKPGMVTRQVIARFEAERQALALMDHPHIAKVLDAGATATGRPYFVMELVRGVSITEYSDAHHLTPRQRLELFVTVCHAVQHAHQKAIIHRDIKPSNVLVTLHDDRPVAKVIDFGIAKATSGQLTDKTLFTGFAQMIGTPLYMSPEQAAMSAIDVDTRSDVYSLGVLLYELLTGTTPFEESRLKEAAFDEIRRIIREEEPAKPSTRLSTSDALPTLSANRGTEPAKLTRLVRGELDWIVMRALEKDRTRRYETANGFAMEVQRYLADEPVSACPPSATYRMRKFVRRNKRQLLTSALVGAMLLVVAGSLGWMARDGAARRSRNAEAVAVLLNQAEDALRAEAADRAAVALEAAERRAADGGAEDLEERLDRSRADLALLRDLDAIDTASWTWVNDAERAARTLGNRWKVTLAAYGVMPGDARSGEAARLANGSLVRDRVLYALDRWLIAERSPDARAVLRAADAEPYRDAVRDAIAARDARTLIALAERPEALVQPARFATALSMLSEVPENRRLAVLESAVRSRPGDFHLLMALHLHYEREVDRTGSPMAKTERIRWCQASMAARPTHVAPHNDMAIALLDAGDRATAIFHLKAATRLDPNYAPGHCNLGSVLSKTNVAEAIRSYETAIRVDPSYTFSYLNLGIALAETGDLERAIGHFRTATRLDPKLADAHFSLGNALLAMNDVDGAVASFQRAIALDANMAPACCNLGNALRAKGDTAAAVLWYEKAIGIDPTLINAHLGLVNALGDQSKLDPAVPSKLDVAITNLDRAVRLAPTDAKGYLNLGIVYQSHGKLDLAIECFRDSIRLDETDAKSHFALGVALHDRGEFQLAVHSYEVSIRIDSTYVWSHSNLGNTLITMREPGKAIPHLRRAIDLDSDNAIALTNMGCALIDLERSEDAIPFLEKAVGIDPNNPTRRYVLANALRASDVDRAIAAYRKVIDLKDDHAEAHCNLGLALLRTGRYADGVDSLRKGDALGRRQSSWPYVSERWLASAERLLAFQRRSPQGFPEQAASPAEHIDLAIWCVMDRRRYADAVLHFAEAFAAEPHLVEDPLRFRYDAAAAAALAGCGRGVGAETLESSETTRLRGVAFDWLEAELASRGRLLSDDPTSAGHLRHELQYWLDDSDVSGVRDPHWLAALPDEERGRWMRLWSNVRDLMARAAK